ncbi:diadenylate cyclase, partial [Thermodesulfobacteriota bacterium]
PLHDGAVAVRNGHIFQAACYLPLSPDEGLPTKWGTRHRAALGLAQRCDASVIVVSEERGDISLASENKMTRVDSEQRLFQLLLEATVPLNQTQKTVKQHVHSLLVHQWAAKVGTFLLISLLWLLLAGQQDFEKASKTVYPEHP